MIDVHFQVVASAYRSSALSLIAVAGQDQAVTNDRVENAYNLASQLTSNSTMFKVRLRRLAPNLVDVAEVNRTPADKVPLSLVSSSSLDCPVSYVIRSKAL